MTDQPDLFSDRPHDPVGAEEAKQAAIERVARREVFDDLMMAAERYVEGLRPGRELTSEDVRASVAARYPAVGQALKKEPRILGAAMTALGRSGLIRPTDRYRVENVATNHKRPQRIWRRPAGEVPQP